MHVRRWTAAAVIAAALPVLAGCGQEGSAAAGAQQAAATGTAVTSTDVEELGGVVTLPVRPAEAIWQYARHDNGDGRVPGPSDSTVTAALRYPPAAARQLVEAVGASGQPGTERAPTWFPADLTGLATRGPDGAPELVGTVYPATAFLSPPLSDGTLLQVGDTGWFVLLLRTT